MGSRSIQLSRSRPELRRGFSLVELLVVIGIIALLMGILIAVISKARRSADGVKCLSNLRQISLAFHQFAIDEAGRLPDPGATDTTWQKSVSKYLGNNADIFHCPGDQELFPTLGTSYDWRDTGDDSTTLAGKVVTYVKRMDTVLAFEALPGWHNKKMMNAVRIDGSASEMTQEECLNNLAMPLR